jgi:hypothetical protein
MKIQELKDTVGKYKTDELISIICELYKAIPKAKKEDSLIDEFINNPQGAKKEITEKKKAGRLIMDIQKDIDVFAENARCQNYLVPNRLVSKTDRPKWRFLVKTLYKEVLLAAETGNNKAACAKALRDLYEVLTYACHYKTFSGDEPFDSVGISQYDFFLSIIKLYRDSVDIEDFIFVGINLIINNNLDAHTLYSKLMDVFLTFCNTNDMRNLVIAKGKAIFQEMKMIPEQKIDYNSQWAGMNYEKRKKLNNITELVARAYCSQYEFNEAIEHFMNNHIEREAEIKIYILVKILFSFKNHEHILKALNRDKTIVLRKSLVDLKEYIEKNNSLPEYF